MSSVPPELSIVIPSFNEELRLPVTLAQVSAYFRGPVGRAIVDNDHLCLSLAGADICRYLRERHRQAQLLIERWNHDGELRRNGAHRCGVSFQPCAPRSGTKRQGSSMVVRKLSWLRSISCKS